MTTPSKVPDGMLVNPALASARVGGDNLLRNCNGQLHSAVNGDNGANSTRMAANGLALVPGLPVQSFNLSNNQPTFLCNNTQGLKTGDMVRFPAGLGGLGGYALRIINVVDNVQFQAQLPFGNLSPASSSAITAYPVGVTSVGSGIVADHWNCTSTMTYWMDDWPANACQGAIRVFGLKKGVATVETFSQFVRKSRLKEYRGRHVTVGAWVWIPYAGCTLYPYISQTSGTTQGAAISSLVAGYQFISIGADIALNTTFVEFGFAFNGVVNSVAYVGIPTAKFGNVMIAEDLGQPPHEVIVARRHHNPPSMVPLVITYPSTQLGTGGTGIYGYAGLDLECLGFGSVHNSIAKVNCKIEATCAAANTIVFIGAMEGDITPSVDLVFGPQVFSQIAGKEIDSSMTWLPLRAGPSSFGSPEGCFAIFGGPASAVINTLTFDFDDVMA